ncbi:ATP-dependent DNA helicase Pif1-like [Rhizophagus clarus]|uniref:ATP-dependent DNA helicase Pif1-like n=1 Tax=Rhizophagus clarus TaxID=94130 RepID=A0A8H3LXW8_9GLOM|nr:ATP-dependent DNA helicase Pif1-like [Rhizophagus clarus]
MFKNQGPPSFPAAVFIKFDAYEGPTITSTEGNNVVPIVPIKRSWEGKSRTIYSRQQVPLCLAWAITVHKSQGLTLSKAKIDIGSKEFAAELTFIVVSRVRSLSDIYFRQFTFDRLQRIKNSSRFRKGRWRKNGLPSG